MSISNREEANKYYQQINQLVDNYIDNYKIRPSKLRSYFKPNSERFQRFLKKNGLDSIDGANRILNDVIDDRVSLEKDGVVTFETFKYFESDEFKIRSMRECLYKGIEKSTLAQEKVLADFFDTNLGSIDIIDSDKHIFKIDDWEGDARKVVIYSSEEFDVIKSNFIDYLFEEISEKKIDLGLIEIDLKSLIDKDNFENKMKSKFTDIFTLDLVSNNLGESWEFEGKSGDHLIWVEI